MIFFCEIINKRTKTSAKNGKSFIDNVHKAILSWKWKMQKNETENDSIIMQFQLYLLTRSEIYFAGRKIKAICAS